MFVQKIKEAKRDEYIEAHRECWKELLKAMKEAGTEREIIWLYGNNVMIYVMAEDFDKSMAKLAKKQVFKDWIAKMEPLLDVIQNYSEEGKVIKLEKVFDLEAQLKKG